MVVDTDQSILRLGAPQNLGQQGPGPGRIYQCSWVCPWPCGHTRQVPVWPLLGLFAQVLYIKIIVKIIRDCEVDLVDNPVPGTLGHSASDTKKLPGCILGEETFLSSVRTPEPSMGPGIFRIG